MRYLEVKEFDTIIHNAEYVDDPDYIYISDEDFADLRESLLQLDDGGDTSGLMDFMHLGSRKGIGETISFSNYVGVLQTDSGMQIEVLPKIDLLSDGKNKTKEIFIKMLRSLNEFPGRAFRDSALDTAHMNLYEIFINMYIKAVWVLVKHGLKSDYIRHEDNNRFFKGKLISDEHIRRNLTHAERFYTAYDEFSENRPENRIIKSTLIKLQNRSRYSENIRQIRQLLTFFDRVDVSMNNEKDFNRIVIDRSTKEYEDILEWSYIFLQNKSFTSFAGDTRSHALLFPMEKVFESYVGKKLSHVIDDNWNIILQDREKYLFDDPPRFALRPDIVIKAQNSRIILDTKWKRLFRNQAANYGIKQTDMYQMLAYAAKYDTPYIWLLYPATSEMHGLDDICFSSSDKNGKIIAQVRVFFLDLADDRDFERLVNKIREQLDGGKP